MEDTVVIIPLAFCLGAFYMCVSVEFCARLSFRICKEACPLLAKQLPASDSPHGQFQLNLRPTFFNPYKALVIHLECQ